VREAVGDAELQGRRAGAFVVGTTPGYARAARLPLAEGRFLADLDMQDRKRSAVLGAAVARQLAPLGEALGAELRLLGQWYRVVGILEDRAAPRARARRCAAATSTAACSCRCPRSTAARPRTRSTRS
jgi:putative ABC transport system permease protein